MRLIVFILAFSSAVYAFDYGGEQKSIFEYNAKSDRPIAVNMLKKPHREISIIVTDEGYYPKAISVFKGEFVRFYITSTTKGKSCFFMPGKEIFLTARSGVVTEAHALFEDSGRFEFYCPSLKKKGHLTVIEKKNHGRSVAGVNQSARSRVWYPKEF